MSTVFRRIDAPTRWGGLPLKAWAGLLTGGLAIVLAIRVLKTPLAPTLTVLAWFVVAPLVLLVLWAHQQGVSVPVLIADATRYALRRKRVIEHPPVDVLTGGVAIRGELPLPAQPAGHAWLNDDLIEN